MKTYILVNKKPVLADEKGKTFLKFYEDINQRRVAIDRIGDVIVSTVFLGFDHNFSDHGPPILFETLVMGGVMDDEMIRACTWEEAEENHKRLVKDIKRFKGI